jgi:hypothetical protein
MSTWRPPPVVRPIAIGIVRRGDDLLLMAVRNDDGAIKGWRPLGGSIAATTCAAGRRPASSSAAAFAAAFRLDRRAWH